MGFWDVVVSAGRYAKNLHLWESELHLVMHLAPDRWPQQRFITINFLQAGWSSWRPTNSVKAMKAQYICTIIDRAI